MKVTLTPKQCTLRVLTRKFVLSTAGSLIFKRRNQSGSGLLTK
uniref:Uncharacterized protein n=1 Tax=Tetranychus urticae TaxID=32264 RepID=T1KCD6_TETUR